MEKHQDISVVFHEEVGGVSVCAGRRSLAIACQGADFTADDLNNNRSAERREERARPSV